MAAVLNPPEIKVKIAPTDHRIIAGPYHPERERWMLDNLLADLRGCRVVLIHEAAGINVYRHKHEVKG